MNVGQLAGLEQQSTQRGIPILGSEKGAWLLKFIQQHQPQQILELGTANGYSGIILGSEGAELLTVDINEQITREALQNFQQYAINASIIIGDAVTVVSDLVKKSLPKNQQKHLLKFDLIFIDFAKKNYIAVLENCIKLTKPGGYIIADNITMAGCQDFKHAVLHHSQLQTEIIAIKDGLSYSKKL